MLGQNKSIRYVQCVVIYVQNLPWLGLPYNQIHVVNFFCTLFGTNPSNFGTFWGATSPWQHYL